jgi:hypothetical protein
VRSQIRGLGVLEYFSTAAQDRAASYCDRAALLREMGEAEPIEKLRDRLLDLSGQFETLADSIDLKRRP